MANVKLTDKQCDQLKCDRCGNPLCEKIDDKNYQILGHYNMGETMRCVPCYEFDQSE